MPEDALDRYIRFVTQFVNQDTVQSFGPETLHRPPHQALLLLSVIDRYAGGTAVGRPLELDDYIVTQWGRYWRVVMGAKTSTVAMPFLALRKEPYWELRRRSGSTAPETRSVRSIREHYEGVWLADELHQLLEEPTARARLAETLACCHFAPSLWYRLGTVSEVVFG